LDQDRGAIVKSIRQVLQGKQHALISVSPGSTVQEALEAMARHDIGALLVMDGNRLAGIFSERDYARKVAIGGKNTAASPVSAVMTEKVFFVTPEQTVTQCLGLMTEKHFRHLPVMENGKVIGVVSIGDLVKEKIAEQSFIIDQLERYITT
jgi:CBS domain-containing protein